jgi:hypothetical protein
LIECVNLANRGLAVLLAGTPGLRRLSLRGCVSLTDKVIPHLAKLTNLRQLKLVYCNRISQQGKAEIRRLLPGCKVTGK